MTSAKFKINIQQWFRSSKRYGWGLRGLSFLAKWKVSYCSGSLASMILFITPNPTTLYFDSNVDYIDVEEFKKSGNCSLSSCPLWLWFLPDFYSICEQLTWTAMLGFFWSIHFIKTEGYVHGTEARFCCENSCLALPYSMSSKGWKH